jgi:hypothetical protein
MSDESPERTDFYEYDLLVQMDTAIGLYEQDRKSYWDARSDEEEWSPLKQLRDEADEIAKLMRKRACALQDVGDQSEVNAIYRVYHERMNEARALYDKYEQLLRSQHTKAECDEILRGVGEALVPDAEYSEDDDPLRLVWESLCIADAWEVVEGSHDRVRRLMQLERLVYEELAGSEMSGTSIRFLSLVSRNYVYGFSTECIAMCRSSLDMALRETITDEHCERAQIKRPKHGYSMASRILAAFHKENKLLEGKSGLHQAAQQVQERGNKAVHYEPNWDSDVLGTIRSTLRVISALSELPS